MMLREKRPTNVNHTTIDESDLTIVTMHTLQTRTRGTLKLQLKTKKPATPTDDLMSLSMSEGFELIMLAKVFNSSDTLLEEFTAHYGSNSHQSKIARGHSDGRGFSEFTVEYGRIDEEEFVELIQNSV